MSYQNNIEAFCLFIHKMNVHELTPDAYEVSFLVANNLTYLTNDDEYVLAKLNKSYDLFDCDNVQNHDGTAQNFVRHSLVKNVYPFLILFGVIANMASFLAMLRKRKLEQRSQRKHVHIFPFCLAILCLADITILIVCGLNEYMEQVFNYSMRSLSTIACKSLYFVCYLTNSFMAYLFAYIARDRWQAASKPIEYKQKQTTNRQRKQILALFAYCVVICGPFFYFATLYTVGTYRGQSLEKKCILAIHAIKKLTFLDALVLSFVPFIITLVFSANTLIALLKEHRALLFSQSHQNHFQSSSKAKGFNFKLKISSTRRISRLKLALSLMMLPISYLISTLPVFVIISLQFVATYLRYDLHFESEFVVAKTLMYANNSINILFFILFGKSLRKELLGMIRCNKMLTKVSCEETNRDRKWKMHKNFGKIST